MEEHLPNIDKAEDLAQRQEDNQENCANPTENPEDQAKEPISNGFHAEKEIVEGVKENENANAEETQPETIEEKPSPEKAVPGEEGNNEGELQKEVSDLPRAETVQSQGEVYESQFVEEAHNQIAAVSSKNNTQERSSGINRQSEEEKEIKNIIEGGNQSQVNNGTDTSEPIIHQQSESRVLAHSDVQFTSPTSSRHQQPQNQSGSLSSNFNAVLERTRKMLASIKTAESNPETINPLPSPTGSRQIVFGSPSEVFRTSPQSFHSPGGLLDMKSIPYTTLDQSQTELIQRALDRIRSRHKSGHMRFSESYASEPLNLEGSAHLQNRSQFDAQMSVDKSSNGTFYSQPKGTYEAKKSKIQNIVNNIKAREGRGPQGGLGAPYFSGNQLTPEQYELGDHYYMPNYYPSYLSALEYYNRGLEITKRILKERYNLSVDQKPEESKRESLVQPAEEVKSEEVKKNKDTPIYQSIDVTSEEHMQREKERAAAEMNKKPKDQVEAAVFCLESQGSQRPNHRQQEKVKSSAAPEQDESDRGSHKQTESGMDNPNISESQNVHQMSVESCSPQKQLETVNSEEDLYKKYNARQVESQNATPEVKTDRIPFNNDVLYESQDPRQADEHLEMASGTLEVSHGNEKNETEEFTELEKNVDNGLAVEVQISNEGKIEVGLMANQPKESPVKAKNSPFDLGGKPNKGVSKGPNTKGGQLVSPKGKEAQGKSLPAGAKTSQTANPFSVQKEGSGKKPGQPQEQPVSKGNVHKPAMDSNQNNPFKGSPKIEANIKTQETSKTNPFAPKSKPQTQAKPTGTTNPPLQNQAGKVLNSDPSIIKKEAKPVVKHPAKQEPKNPFATASLKKK